MRRMDTVTRWLAALLLAIAAPVWADTVSLPVRVNEGSDAVLSVSLVDPNNQPVQPTSMAWWVTDEATGATLYYVDPAPTPGSTILLSLPPEAQFIANPNRDSEMHDVVVVFSYAGPTPTPSGVPSTLYGVAQARYQVDNDPTLVVGCVGGPSLGPTPPCGGTPVPTASYTRTPTLTPTRTRTPTP